MFGVAIRTSTLSRRWGGHRRFRGTSWRLRGLLCGNGIRDLNAQIAIDGRNCNAEIPGYLRDCLSLLLEQMYLRSLREFHRVRDNRGLGGRLTRCGSGR